ncbi:MAG: hypothetical protein IJK92_06265 [Bacteroidales bacterium]|nr:hypothetical protein [Bacteroidales bacterium]
MKRKNKSFIAIALCFTALLSSISLKAQVELENTFNDHVYYYSSLEKYINVTTNKNTISINLYNGDHSVYKSINITPPYGYDYSDINYYSQTLFNDDEDIEFLVTYYNYSEDMNKISICKLYNEQGSVIEDFGYSYYVYSSLYNEGGFKLKLEKRFYNNDSNRFYYSTEVYSLPGTGYSLSENGVQVNNAPQNTSAKVVALPYLLNGGESADLFIYNMENNLVEKKVVDSTFDRIMLDVSGYAPGIYYYTVDGTSHKFIVK